MTYASDLRCDRKQTNTHKSKNECRIIRRVNMAMSLSASFKVTQDVRYLSVRRSIDHTETKMFWNELPINLFQGNFKELDQLSLSYE